MAANSSQKTRTKATQEASVRVTFSWKILFPLFFVIFCFLRFSFVSGTFFHFSIGSDMSHDDSGNEGDRSPVRCSQASPSPSKRDGFEVSSKGSDVMDSKWKEYMNVLFQEKQKEEQLKQQAQNEQAKEQAKLNEQILHDQLQVLEAGIADSNFRSPCRILRFLVAFATSLTPDQVKAYSKAAFHHLQTIDKLHKDDEVDNKKIEEEKKKFEKTIKAITGLGEKQIETAVETVDIQPISKRFFTEGRKAKANQRRQATITMLLLRQRWTHCIQLFHEKGRGKNDA